MTDALELGGFIGRDETNLEKLEALLDERGEDGWELVQVLPAERTTQGRAAHVLIFKRPVEVVDGRPAN
jgi:hypothetical protein